MSPIEQECLDSLIQEKIHIQQKFERRPQLFVHKSFKRVVSFKVI